MGRDLFETLTALLERIPGSPHGPQLLATTLGVDKVLTSRLLKAARTRDPMAVVHHLPGPDPLRRVLKGAERCGVSADTVTDARAAVDRFEQFVRREVGDRSALDAMISAWLPEVRRDFELRRKQAAFKAMSQLKGAMALTSLSTVLLNPSGDGEHLDIVWVFGLLGLQRLRPGVKVKFATRRMAPESAPRRPTTLDGVPVRGVEDVRLDEFCDAPPARVDVQTLGDVVHYTLGGDDFGPKSEVDVVMAEANLREIPRYVPKEKGRKGNVFAEVGTPARTLIFDVLVHEDVYPGSDPGLLIYDTALDGVADINDPTRDVDRLDMIETVQHLGRGAGTMRDARIPRYVELLRHVFDRMGFDDQAFRAYRVRIDYPLYGSQVAVTFDPPPPPKK
ncbi:MAG: hypothetical protein GY715_22330 [Planctomycetes bacterium]|nr:hypothetical protein [Planctomycetota bacterium]